MRLGVLTRDTKSVIYETPDSSEHLMAKLQGETKALQYWEANFTSPFDRETINLKSGANATTDEKEQSLLDFEEDFYPKQINKIPSKEKLH